MAVAIAVYVAMPFIGDPTPDMGWRVVLAAVANDGDDNNTSNCTNNFASNTFRVLVLTIAIIRTYV